MAQDRQKLETALLAVRSQRGDRGAFEELVKLWEKRLYYYLRRLTATEADAWELLQETWLQVFRSLAKLRDPAALPSFLYATARHVALTRRRGQRWETTDGDCDAVADENGDLPAFDDAEQVHQALDRLPALQREALTLFFLQDLTLEEMAALLEVPVGTVKSRLHYARQALRKILTRGDHHGG